MRKQFNLQEWLKDKSQKVVDQDGRPVRIICTDADGLYPIIGLVDNKIPLPCGKDGRPPYIGGGGGSLFLVTPEEELSDFEKAVADVCFDWQNIEPEIRIMTDSVEDAIKEDAAKLLTLAIDARAKELSDGLKQSKLDKDSIPYHLIEFMCNLYTCQNWKEIEETAELYVTRIKAAPMKNLPRWRKANGKERFNERLIVLAGDNDLWCTNYAEEGEYYISFSSLDKLPKEE